MNEQSKIFLIRTGTVYGLLTFDHELDAIDASRRYHRHYEIRWQTYWDGK